jgi:tetratricopeptide (TPR) repeat protein
MAIRFIFLALLFTVAASAQDIKALVAEADACAEQKFDNRKALEALNRAEKLEPKNYAVLWRLSRTWVDIAEHLPAQTDAQKDEQLRQYQTALDYAQKAIAANPNGMMGYLRRAIANGRIALFKGVFSVVGLVKDVKSDCEKAIKIGGEEPRQMATAHYVLGRTHAKVCEKPYLVRLPLGLGWGDRDVAAEEFEKAIVLNPEFIMFRLDAARNYAEMDEYKKARAHLGKIPSLPTRDEDDERFRKEAASLLGSIKNE